MTDLTRKFLKNYKSLVEQFEHATDVHDLLPILAKSSGLSILPSLLFLASGQLKNYDTLRLLTYQQLDFMIKKNTAKPGLSEVLLINLIQTKNKQAAWVNPSPHITDTRWFQKTYHETPRSVAATRSILLRHNVKDLCVYLNYVTLQPWDDLDLLISAIRQTKGVN